MSVGRKSEFEVPPNTKVRVVATVEKRLCEEMALIHEQETKRAKAEDRSEPDWSNTIEMLLRKGVRAYGNRISEPKSPQQKMQVHTHSELE